jgi:hypothetical protein
LSGNVAAMDTKQVLARGDKRLMVLLGVEDLILVETAHVADRQLRALAERAPGDRRTDLPRYDD